MLEIHAWEGALHPLRLSALDPPAPGAQPNHHRIPEDLIDPLNIQIHPAVLELAYS